MRNPVSVIMLARNEEANIAHALRAVEDFASQIIVVDMESTDATALIAERFGAQIVPHEVIPNFDFARVKGIKNAAHEWILVLDADEVCTPKLCEEMANIISADVCDVCHVPRANMAFSGFAQHESEFPEMLPRLFKKSHMDIDNYTGAIHSFFAVLPGARVCALKASYPSCCLLHFSNPTITSFVAKINQYTTVEALGRYRKYEHRLFYLVSVFLKPPFIFCKRYFLKKGCLDGWRGFWISLIWAFYEVLVFAKVWEMRLFEGHIPTDQQARERMRALVAEEIKHL